MVPIGLLSKLTDGALADRLRSIGDNPLTWPRLDRQAYLYEAARRLERKGPPTVDS